jgi:hypothetical protein
MVPGKEVEEVSYSYPSCPMGDATRWCSEKRREEKGGNPGKTVKNVTLC